MPSRRRLTTSKRRGVAPSPGFTSAAAAMLTGFGGMMSVFTHPDALAFVRVIGAVFGRLGEAGVSLSLADVESRMPASGIDELEIAKKGHEAIGLVEGLPDMLEPVFRRHIMQANERTRLAAIAQDERLQYRYAIGLVDLVGFTERSATMAPRELASSGNSRAERTTSSPTLVLGS